MGIFRKRGASKSQRSDPCQRGEGPQQRRHQTQPPVHLAFNHRQVHGTYAAGDGPAPTLRPRSQTEQVLTTHSRSQTPPSNEARVGDMVQVFYDQQNPGEGQLRLVAGDFIKLLAKDNDGSGWWYGALYAQEGYFPKDYTVNDASEAGEWAKRAPPRQYMDAGEARQALQTFRDLFEGRTISLEEYDQKRAEVLAMLTGSIGGLKRGKTMTTVPKTRYSHRPPIISKAISNPNLQPPQEEKPYGPLPVIAHANPQPRLSNHTLANTLHEQLTSLMNSDLSSAPNAPPDTTAKRESSTCAA